VKNAAHITSNDIMFFKSEYCNAPKFASELRSFLISKGYILDKYLGVSWPHDYVGYAVDFIDTPGNNKNYCIEIVVGRF
jgi:hypothetical protein